MQRSQTTARIWWNARRDAERQLPPSTATALGDTERQIQATANMEIRSAWRSYSRKSRPRAGRLTALKKALHELYEPEYERLCEETGRSDVLVYIPRAVHLVLLAALSLGEAAFNMVAFNVFREPAFYTVLMAGAVSLAIPICAWVLGIWLRQWPEPHARTAVKVVVLSATVVGAVVGINWLRAAYVAELAPDFAKAHPGLSVVFLAVNLVVLAAAVVVSYLSHDPEPGFAEAKAKVDAHRIVVHALEGELEALAEEFRSAMELAKERGWQRIGYYRMVNRRYRPAPPAYFDNETDKHHRPQFVEVSDLAAEPEPIEPQPSGEEEAA
jgi:hypothetical protein